MQLYLVRITIAASVISTTSAKQMKVGRWVLSRKAWVIQRLIFLTRPPFKYTVKHTNKPPSAKHTAFYARLDDWIRCSIFAPMLSLSLQRDLLL